MSDLNPTMRTIEEEQLNQQIPEVQGNVGEVTGSVYTPVQPTNVALEPKVVADVAPVSAQSSPTINTISAAPVEKIDGLNPDLGAPVNTTQAFLNAQGSSLQ